MIYCSSFKCYKWVITFHSLVSISIISNIIINEIWVLTIRPSIHINVSVNGLNILPVITSIILLKSIVSITVIITSIIKSHLSEALIAPIILVRSVISYLKQRFVSSKSCYFAIRLIISAPRTPTNILSLPYDIWDNFSAITSWKITQDLQSIPCVDVKFSLSNTLVRNWSLFKSFLSTICSIVLYSSYVSNASNAFISIIFCLIAMFAVFVFGTFFVEWTVT